MASNLQQIAKVIDQAKAAAEADKDTIQRLQAASQQPQPPAPAAEHAQDDAPASQLDIASLELQTATSQPQPPEQTAGSTAQLPEQITTSALPKNAAVSAQEAASTVHSQEATDVAPQPATSSDAGEAAAAEQLEVLQHRHAVLEADLQTVTAERDAVKQQATDLQAELKRLQDQSEQWQSRAKDWEKEGRLLQDHVQALQDGATQASSTLLLQHASYSITVYLLTHS